MMSAAERQIRRDFLFFHARRFTQFKLKLTLEGENQRVVQKVFLEENHRHIRVLLDFRPIQAVTVTTLVGKSER